MLKIKKNDISLTRGDSAYIPLQIFDGSGNVLIPTARDVVRCQVRDAVNDGQLLFEGQIVRDTIVSSEGNEEVQLIWHIRPEDTRNANMTKSYVYDVQIECENGDIFTVIPAADFKIMDEVTLPLDQEEGP